MNQSQEQIDLEVKRALWENNMSLPIIISGVCFAIDIAFLPNLVQTHKLTQWETCSLSLFAIALPCLAVNAFIMWQTRTTKVVLQGKAKLFLAIQLAGYFASIAGIWASIMNVSSWIGSVFLIITVCLIIFCAKAHSEIAKKRGRL